MEVSMSMSKLVGRKILALEMNEEKDVLRFRLHSEDDLQASHQAGDCLLEMRNESNGYYSGCIQDREPLNAEELQKMAFKPVMGDV